MFDFYKVLRREKEKLFFCFHPAMTLAKATTVIAKSAASSTPARTAGPSQSLKNPSCLVRMDLDRHRKIKSAYPIIEIETGSSSTEIRSTVFLLKTPGCFSAEPGFSSAVTPTSAVETPPRETAMDSQARKVRSLAGRFFEAGVEEVEVAVEKMRGGSSSLRAARVRRRTRDASVFAWSNSFHVTTVCFSGSARSKPLSKSKEKGEIGRE